jgi:hypothetical protein
LQLFVATAVIAVSAAAVVANQQSSSSSAESALPMSFLHHVHINGASHDAATEQQPDGWAECVLDVYKCVPLYDLNAVSAELKSRNVAIVEGA